jgi:hypothetical protein
MNYLMHLNTTYTITVGSTVEVELPQAGEVGHFFPNRGEPPFPFKNGSTTSVQKQQEKRTRQKRRRTDQGLILT